MAVVGRLPLNVFFHIGVLIQLGTILLCYTLSVSLGHVPAWLPMISDCAIYPPEKYAFRWGLVIGSTLFGAQTVLIYGADKPYAKSKLSLILGLLAAFCLSVVAVVSEAEDNTIHSSAAVTFFVVYEVNMAVLTWFTPQYEREERPSGVAYFFRQFCVVLTGLILVTFVFLSKDWSKHKLYIAICEWSGTILILLFNWSFAADFTMYSVGEIENDASGIKNRKSNIPLLS